VFYSDFKSTDWRRVPLEGGKAEVLPSAGVPGAGASPLTSISRDDQMLATYGLVPDSTTNTYRTNLAIINAGSMDAPSRVLHADTRIVVNSAASPQFTPDGRAVVYPIRGENNVENLWLQPLDGKPGRQITKFSSEQIFGFQWSPDAKELWVARGHDESDVVLLRDTSK
jgi:eukaryotic-like serine/threonine-protein kinase